MFRAMALKELREIRGFALAALVIYALVLVDATAPELSSDLWLLLTPLRGFSFQQQTLLPFVNDAFVLRFHVASAALAIALGLSQSLGETVRGTYPFLFHRPVTRRWLIGMKLSVGMAVYLLCAAVPLLVYGLWAATPGTHAGPFEWSMTWPAWSVWLAMTLLYVGAFLTGIRPGRWYASRLLPFVFVAAGVSAAAGVATSSHQAPLPVCLVVLGADVWVISAILFVARSRDFS